MTTETQVLATHRGSILALLRHPLQLLCLSGLHLILLARIHCLVAKLDVLLSRLTLFMPLLNTSTVLMMNFQKLLSFYQKRGSMRYLQASNQLQQYDGDTTQAFKVLPGSPKMIELLQFKCRKDFSGHAKKLIANCIILLAKLIIL